MKMKIVNMSKRIDTCVIQKHHGQDLMTECNC